jgi:phosphoadenosine phosphosulfate reductase
MIEANKTSKIMNIEELNAKYLNLDLNDRIKEIYKDFAANDMILTSSFAANSSFLLHLYSSNAPVKPRVYFIDTFYHFEETLDYKNWLSRKYNLEVYDIIPDYEEHLRTRDHELWKNDPDLCCHINKVKPIERIKKNFKVWSSGLMRSQNEHRKNLNIFEYKDNIIRFYPIIDVSLDERQKYIEEHKLDYNPLVYKGYNSIGCSHCTQKGKNREGRWVGLAKTECGLHI